MFNKEYCLDSQATHACGLADQIIHQHTSTMWQYLRLAAINQ